jgi:hypothetical protein
VGLDPVRVTFTVRHADGIRLMKVLDQSGGDNYFYVCFDGSETQLFSG